MLVIPTLLDFTQSNNALTKILLVVTSTNTDNVLGDLPSGRLAYPTLQGATAEAAFMTGMERNSDVVFASACKPRSQVHCFPLNANQIITDADAPRCFSKKLQSLI